MNVRRLAACALLAAATPVLGGALPFSNKPWVEKAPWEWNQPVRRSPSGADPRARQVYAPLYLRQLTDPSTNVQSVLDAITQGGVWNKRELAAPAFDPATNLVFVGTSDRRFRALSAVTGNVVWEMPLAGRVSSQPIIDGPLVIFGGDDGGIYAVRKGTGVQQWRYQADSEVAAAPTVFGSSVYFHTALDTVVALDRQTGDFRWQTRHPLPVGITLLGESRPAVGVVLNPGEGPARTVVFVGHADGQLSAMDASDGHVLWSTTIGRGDDFVDVDANIHYDGGIVYAAAYHGGVYALDPLTGATLWNAPVDNISRMSITANTLVAAGPGKVMLLDRQNGRARWRFTFQGGSPSTPVVHRGRVLVSSDKGVFYVLNFTDGRPLQYYGGHPGFTSAPAVGGDGIFLLSNGGWLHALSDRFAGIVAAQRFPW